MFQNDSLQATLRLWAGIASLAYGGAIALVVALLIQQGDYGDVLSAMRLVVPAVLALAVFVWGLVVWDSRIAWVARILAWVALAASTAYTFISFSFVMAPLLASTVIVLWPWRRY